MEHYKYKLHRVRDVSRDELMFIDSKHNGDTG